MKKKLLWLIPAVLAVAAAFFLPRLILTIQQHETRKRVETLPVEDNFHESGEMSVVEKLQLLCDDDAEAISLRVTIDEAAVQNAFDTQLDQLIALGVLGNTVAAPTLAEDREILAVNPLIVMRTDRLLRVYEIYTGTLSAIMDMDTGKLYALVSWTETEAAMEKTYLTMQMNQTNRNKSGTATELQAWAQYYGLQMEEITFDDKELSDVDGNWNLASCIFYDAAGNRVGFSLSNNYANYTIGWRCIDVALAESLRDSIRQYQNVEPGSAK